MVQMVQGSKYGTVPSNTVELAGLGPALSIMTDIVILSDCGRLTMDSNSYSWNR